MRTLEEVAIQTIPELHGQTRLDFAAAKGADDVRAVGAMVWIGGTDPQFFGFGSARFAAAMFELPAIHKGLLSGKFIGGFRPRLKSGRTISGPMILPPPTGEQSQIRFLTSLIQNRSSRHEEALFLLKFEPPHVGCYGFEIASDVTQVQCWQSQFSTVWSPTRSL